MPFVPTPNCVSVEMLYTQDGQQIENVLHYVKASPWGLASMEELAQGIFDIWSTTWAADNPTNLTWDGIRVTDLSSQTGPVLIFQDDLPIVGTNVSPALPNNCAMVVTKRTALRGRSFRGRVYHPGLTEARVTGNTITTNFATTVANQYENLIVIEVQGGADEALMVVLSLVADGQPRTEGQATPVTRMEVNLTVDSQRRRLPGRGR